MLLKNTLCSTFLKLYKLGTVPHVYDFCGFVPIRPPPIFDPKKDEKENLSRNTVTQFFPFFRPLHKFFTNAQLGCSEKSFVN